MHAIASAMVSSQASIVLGFRRGSEVHRADDKNKGGRTMPKIDRDGVEIYYEVHGEGRRCC